MQVKEGADCRRVLGLWENIFTLLAVSPFAPNIEQSAKRALNRFARPDQTRNAISSSAAASS
jgi:hypothetical protein